MIAELVLSGTYRETARQSQSLLTSARTNDFVFERFVRACESVRRNRKADQVLVRVKRSFQASTVAALEEIRGELTRLREAGKRLVFYATEYAAPHLYLASACHERLLHPQGSLRAPGLARTSIFFRRLADQYDFSIQVARRGRFKSAGDRFRLEHMDEADREQYQRWLDVGAGDLMETIRSGYGAPDEQIRRLLAGETLTPEQARDAGWIDRACSYQSLRQELDEAKTRVRRLKPRKHIGRGKRVAVLVFEGGIVEGRNQSNPILGQMIGSERFTREVDALRKNKRVKAVVLRVNSGGGSAVASEEIRHSLARLAAQKPLVVSMSQVAGSGGYWISMSGHTVLARATTLTGSIGVINLVANIGAALEKQGITHDTLRTHDHADALLAFRPLTDEEYAQLDHQVASIYEQFLALVAEHRNLTRDEVHERAQGRVWSGLDAHAQRLVDQVGGLRDAIDEAGRRAGVDNPRVDFHPRVKKTLVHRLIAREADDGLSALARLVAGAAAIAERGRDQIAAGGPLALVRALAQLTNRPLALMPDSLLHYRSLDALDADLQIE